LFFGASSLDGTFFALNFEKQTHDFVEGSGGGGIFSLISFEYEKMSCVAFGCEDGHIKIIDVTRTITHADKPKLRNIIQSSGHVITALAWVKGEKLPMMFAGAADGTIRRFIYRLKASKGWICNDVFRAPNDNRDVPTKIWCLLNVSSANLLISGDSLGKVHFWNSETGSLDYSFKQNDQNAPVLAAALTQDESKVFVAGVDSRVVCIRKVSKTIIDENNENIDENDHNTVFAWVLDVSTRKHTHDINTLCIVNPTTLLSAGVDTKICSYNTNFLKSNKQEVVYSWAYLSYKSSITLSKQKRILCYIHSQKETAFKKNSNKTSTRIEFYKLLDDLHIIKKGQNQQKYNLALETQKVMDENTKQKYLVESLEIQSMFNLTCCTISPNGEYMAVSDANSLLIFYLNFDEKGEKSVEKFHQLTLEPTAQLPASILKFIPSKSDQVKLISVSPLGKIQILRIHHCLSEKTRFDVMVQQSFELECLPEARIGLSYEKNTISCLSVNQISLSTCGNWFATLQHYLLLDDNCTNLCSNIQVFHKVDTEVDSLFQHYWTLPLFTSTSAFSTIYATLVQIIDGALVVACLDNTFYIFNLLEKQLSDWSKDVGGFPLPVQKSFTPQNIRLTNGTFPIQVVFFNSGANEQSLHNTFLIRSYSSFCVVDLDLPIPEHGITFGFKKNSGQNKYSSKNFSMCNRYKGILFIDYLENEKEMVVVEHPWRAVLQHLPDPLFRKEYCT